MDWQAVVEGQRVVDLAVSRDGARLVTVCTDKSIKIFTLPSMLQARAGGRNPEPPNPIPSNPEPSKLNATSELNATVDQQARAGRSQNRKASSNGG